MRVSRSYAATAMRSIGFPRRAAPRLLVAPYAALCRIVACQAGSLHQSRQ